MSVGHLVYHINVGDYGKVPTKLFFIGASDESN